MEIIKIPPQSSTHNIYCSIRRSFSDFVDFYTFLFSSAASIHTSAHTTITMLDTDSVNEYKYEFDTRRQVLVPWLKIDFVPMEWSIEPESEILTCLRRLNIGINRLFAAYGQQFFFSNFSQFTKSILIAY